MAAEVVEEFSTELSLVEPGVEAVSDGVMDEPEADVSIDEPIWSVSLVKAVEEA